MKKFLLLIMPVMLVSFTGCDFLRAVAGRPTEEKLEEKRIEMLKAEEKALMARIDSLRTVEEQETADPLPTLEGLKASGVMVSGPDKLRGVSGPGLDYRYYIIVGVFRESLNARKIFNSASEKGYSPVLINSRSGMMAVGLAPTDDSAVIAEKYVQLKKESFCPKDAWILVNE